MRRLLNLIIVALTVAVIAAACATDSLTVTAAPDPDAPTDASSDDLADEPAAPADDADDADPADGEGDDPADPGDVPADDPAADDPAADDAAEPTVAPEPTTAPTATPAPEPDTDTDTVAPGTTETIVIEYTETRYEYQDSSVLTAARDGSYRWERLSDDTTEIEVYDAPTDSGASAYAFGDDEAPTVRTSGGNGLGAPDYGSTFWLTGNNLAQLAVSFEGTAFAGADTFLGRDVIVFETDVVPNAIGGGPDAVELLVDSETGLVLQFLGYEAGDIVWDLTAQSVEAFDTKLDVFALDPSLGEAEEGWFGNFQRVALDDVAGIVGYAPLVPATVPDGYELVEVAVAPGQGEGYTGPEGSNPPNVDVVNLRYANGWHSFVVSTRVAVDDGFGWADPFGGEGQIYESSEFIIEAGALAGETASYSVAPETIIHLWVETPDLIVTISGPLRDADLIDIVSSLDTA